MRIRATHTFCCLILVAGVLAAPSSASAAPTPDFFIAKIERGKLVIIGKTKTPNQKVLLDDSAAETVSDRGRVFVFNLVYLPTDCMVTVSVGDKTKTAPVVGCGPRAANRVLVSVPNQSSSHPSIPDGLTRTCYKAGQPAPTCPVVKWNGITYWAFSYIDNRFSLGIVGYRDTDGTVAINKELPGARYLETITVGEDVVTFKGQNNAQAPMSFASPFLQLMQ